RVLAAQAAAHAAFDHGGDRIAAQRIRVVLHRERRATREPDARVIARAGVLVDPVFDADISFALGEFFGNDGPQLPLPFELALALGDDNLQALVVGRHRLLERLRHFAHAVVVDRPHPADADSGERALDRHVAGLERAVLRARGQLLRAGRRAVAVLHDDEDAV